MRILLLAAVAALSLAAGAAQAGEVLYGKARIGDDIATVRAAQPAARPPKEPDRLNDADLGLVLEGQFHLGGTWRIRWFFLDGGLDAVQLTRSPAPGHRADDIRQAQLFLKGLSVIHRGEWRCKQPVDPEKTSYLDCDIEGDKINVGYSYMDFGGGPYEIIVYRSKRPLD
jgi:hypothetical protein